MRTILLVVAAVFMLAGAVSAEPNWTHKGPVTTLLNTASATADTQTFTTTTIGKIARGGEKVGLGSEMHAGKVVSHVGFKIVHSVPFKVFVTNEGAGVDTFADAWADTNFALLMQDPINSSYSGPEFCVEFEYWGTAASVIVNTATADSAQIWEYFDLSQKQ